MPKRRSSVRLSLPSLSLDCLPSALASTSLHFTRPFLLYYFHLLTAIDVDPFFTADLNPNSPEPKKEDHQLVLISSSCNREHYLVDEVNSAYSAYRLQTSLSIVSTLVHKSPLFCLDSLFPIVLSLVALCVEHASTSAKLQRSLPNNPLVDHDLSTTAKSTPGYDHVLTPKNEEQGGTAYTHFL